MTYLSNIPANIDDVFAKELLDKNVYKKKESKVKFDRKNQNWKMIFDIFFKNQDIDESLTNVNKYGILDAKYSYSTAKEYINQISNYMGYLNVTKGGLIYLHSEDQWKKHDILKGRLFGQNITIYEFYFKVVGTLREWEAWAKFLLNEIRKID